jgi:hypothetical protein
MAAAITVSVSGVSYAALNIPEVTGSVQVTADAATCRAVDTAIVAYLARNDEPPARITDLAPFVTGDLTAYRIEGGLAAGPGCPA